MGIKSIQNYRYKAAATEGQQPFFELTSIHLNTSCVMHENEIAQHYKIYWIEEGNGQYQIDFKSFSIEGAGLFFLSPGQVLTVQSEKVKSGYQLAFDREFYCVETHGKEIACNGVLFNNVHRATMIPLSPNDAPTFWQLIQNMANELEKPGPAHREMLETYLRMLLIQALRKLEELQPKLQAEPEEAKGLAADFIALVNKQFRALHRVADYADQLFVSPKSLSKRLKAEGYPTPTILIRDRIVLQAKRDLRFTSKSVKEIAYELGFDDPAYFTRLFKKSEGIAPLVYRDQNV